MHLEVSENRTEQEEQKNICWILGTEIITGLSFLNEIWIWTLQTVLFHSLDDISYIYILYVVCMKSLKML